MNSFWGITVKNVAPKWRSKVTGLAKLSGGRTKAVSVMYSFSSGGELAETDAHWEVYKCHSGKRTTSLNSRGERLFGPLKYQGSSGETTVRTTQKHTALSESHQRSILPLNLCLSLALEILLCCVGWDVCWHISKDQTQLLQFLTQHQHLTSYYY